MLSTIVDSSVLGGSLELLLQDRTRYFVCTLYRQRSALSTSFKFCLEETKDVDQHKNPVATSSSCKYEPPLVLLGARRSGAMSSGFLIHTSFDPKGGKDKAIIGRLQRLNSTGRCVSSSISLKSYIAVHVSSRSMDKLLRIKAVALSGSFQSDGDDPVTSDTTSSVNSPVTIVTPTSPSTSGPTHTLISNSATSHSGTGSVEEAWVIKSLDALVENKLETEQPMLSSPALPRREFIKPGDVGSTTPAFEVLKLRSAVPHSRAEANALKTESKSGRRSNDGISHSVNFTPGFRAKEASRKNVVVESLQPAFSDKSAAVGLEDEYCPVFQVRIDRDFISFYLIFFFSTTQGVITHVLCVLILFRSQLVLVDG